MASPTHGPAAGVHRIEVNVIEVAHEVVLVVERVLSIPPLPNPRSPLAARLAEIRLPSGQSMRKGAFDQPPTRDEIRTTIRPAPDCAPVIRLDNGSLDREGMPCAHPPKRAVRQQRAGDRPD
jgi:hypothetical protein